MQNGIIRLSVSQHAARTAPPPPLSPAAHAHLAFEARWAFGVPQKAIAVAVVVAAAAFAVPLIMKLERDCHLYRTLRLRSPECCPLIRQLRL